MPAGRYLALAGGEKALKARLAHLAYRNPVAPLTGPARSDTAEVAELRLEWRALRNLLLNAGWQHYRQDSNDPTVRFSGRIVTVGGSLLL